MSEKYYREWCSNLYTRAGNMVEVEKLKKILPNMECSGYCSLYYFKEEDAHAIKASGTSSGMNQFAVGQDCLYIDIDDGGVSLPQIESDLQKLGLGYEVYFSGSKGNHVKILQTQFIFSKHLPHSQKMWVKDNISIAVDESLYMNSRIFSNVGRIHNKTKKKKEFLYAVEGNKLDLSLIEKPEVKFEFKAVSSEGRLSLGLQGLVDLDTYFPSQGSRHLRYYGVSMDLLSAGLSEHTVKELLITINNTKSTGKSEAEVIHAVNGAVATIRRGIGDVG
jgi:hypothetical protein